MGQAEMVKIPWYPFSPAYFIPKIMKLVMASTILYPFPVDEQVEIHCQSLSVKADFTPHGAGRGSPGVPPGHLIPQAVGMVD
jgi:hypothetical protein